MKKFDFSDRKLRDGALMKWRTRELRARARRGESSRVVTCTRNLFPLARFFSFASPRALRLKIARVFHRERNFKSARGKKGRETGFAFLRARSRMALQGNVTPPCCEII